MKKDIVLLGCVVFFLSCNPMYTRESNEKMHNGLLTFLALGDSYTIGEGVAESGRWPVQLADSLTRRGQRCASPVIIARTGWTTNELRVGIEQANPAATYNLVSLLIGVNNQYRGPSRGFTPEQYRSEFIDLLRQAIAFTGGDPSKVLVLSIPDYSVTPFVPEANKQRTAREIDEYNTINKEESLKARTNYVDITPISRLAANDSSLLATDGLHPSAKMYRMWVEKIVEEVMSCE